MRGAHLDVCVLGAFQLSARGDLANWHTGAAGAIPAVGGTMDLAIGAENTFVMMTLFSKDGQPKLVPACTYPLTRVWRVSRICADLATFQITGDEVVVTETFGLSLTDDSSPDRALSAGGAAWPRLAGELQRVLDNLASCDDRSRPAVHCCGAGEVASHGGRHRQGVSVAT